MPAVATAPGFTTTQSKTDVFISYSREDKDFVKQLHDALQKEGRKTWIDWEGIPPSAEWFQEILQAIENTDAFVLVISPHSATSKVCTSEVAHAIKYNKRIIPVLRADVDGNLLPPSVQERQWVFCRDVDSFEAGIRSLLAAMDTDLDWLRSHTRLLGRALEWERHKGDYSFALRGRDLKQAETFLRNQEIKEPRLLPLQLDYILASRRDANKLFSIVIGVSALALTVVIVFGLLFWQKREEQAFTLASNYRERGFLELVRNNPLAAEVLFAKALGINNVLGTSGLIIQARARSPRLLWISPQVKNASIIAISNDGKLFAVRSQSKVEIWSIDTKAIIHNLPATGGVKVAAFDPNDHLLALGRGKNIDVWDLSSSASVPLRTIKTPYEITSVNFGPEGHFIAGALTGDILVWDRLASSSQTPRLKLSGHTDRVTGAVLTKDSRFLVSASWDATIRIWDLTDGRELRALAGHDNSLLCVALDSNDELIASAGWDATIIIWDFKTGKQIRTLEGHKGSVLSVAFSPDGHWLASTSEDHTARLWEVDRGKHVLILPGHQNDVSSVAFQQAGTEYRLAIGDMNGILRLWGLGEIGQRDELVTLRGHRGSVSMFDLNPRKPLLVSGSTDSTIRLWDLETKQLKRLLPKQQDKVFSVRFQSGRTIFCVGNQTTDNPNLEY